MIPYYRTHGIKQQIDKKLIRVRYNIWVLVGVYGYVVQFESQQGVKKWKQVVSSTKWRLGKIVVLQRM